MYVLIQSGGNLWPQDEHGYLIFEDQTSISETWEVRVAFAGFFLY